MREQHSEYEKNKTINDLVINPCKSIGFIYSSIFFNLIFCIIFICILIGKYSESDGSSWCLWFQSNMNNIIHFAVLFILMSIPTFVIAGFSISYNGKINKATDNIKNRNLDYNAINFTTLSILNKAFFSLHFAFEGVIACFLIAACTIGGGGSEYTKTLL